MAQVMAQAYTPGLKVAGRVVQRARRVLPIAGEVVVRLGQRVGAQEVVARRELPGDVTPVNLANLLNVSAGDVPGYMLKREGEKVSAGEVLARTKGMFGWFQTEATSPVGGTLETVSSVTGQVMIRGKPSPVEVFAFLAGDVVEVVQGSGVVVEAEVAYIQGIFGIGGEAYGMLRATCDQPGKVLEESLLHEGMRGGGVGWWEQRIRRQRSVQPREVRQQRPREEQAQRDRVKPPLPSNRTGKTFRQELP